MTPSERAVRAYIDAFNRGDWDAMADIFTEDARIQGVLGHASLDWALGIWKSLHEAMACRLEPVAIVADGDQVAVRYVERGSFVAPFIAYPDTVPTGKSYEVVAMEWFECREGRIAHRWGARDSDAVRRQILGG
jgi:predicted ester cyclase